MITTINEFKENIVRVSCAGLCKIKISDKYLLMLNNSQLKQGKKVYTPIGGGIEYFENALSFLNDIVIKFERETPDLRFTILKDDLHIFTEWFNKRIDRELYVNREVKEELVDETNILSNITDNDFTEKYIKMVEDNEYYNDIMNYRFFEIFEIDFKKHIIHDLLIQLNNELLYLAEEGEIKNGITDNGIKIGNNSKAIL